LSNNNYAYFTAALIVVFHSREYIYLYPESALLTRMRKHNNNQKCCAQCGVTFIPSKYRRAQKYCSGKCREEARREYKRKYNSGWRKKNPEYMKEYYQKGKR